MKDEINISFKELIDYIRDKDFEIESYRYKYIKMLKEKQTYKERNEKAIEYINKELKDMPINGCYERLKNILFLLGSDKDE